MDARDWDATTDILAQRWRVDLPAEHAGAADWDLLLEVLEERILDLLQRNPNRLMSALYILDISEKRFAQAMDQPTMNDRAHDLAYAVLERETEKIRSRREYAEARARTAAADRLPPPDSAE